MGTDRLEAFLVGELSLRVSVDRRHPFQRETNQRILVVIGATVDGKNELLALTEGFLESGESRKEFLRDLKLRGLTVDLKLAVGDGALGFWKALPQVYGKTRAQRCWVHKTTNVSTQKPPSASRRTVRRSPPDHDGIRII